MDDPTANKAKAKADLRIGRLLIEAGLVSENDLSEALENSICCEEPVGKILLSSKLIDERLLHGAIEVQSMVRDATIPLEVGLQTLAFMNTSGATLEVAVERINHVYQTDRETNRLGDFLCLSGIATREKLDEAIELAHKTSLPLGKILIALGIVWDDLLEKALSVQAKVRDGEIDKSEAIAVLTREFEKPIRWKPISAEGTSPRT